MSSVHSLQHSQETKQAQRDQELCARRDLTDWNINCIINVRDLPHNEHTCNLCR